MSAQTVHFGHPNTLRGHGHYGHNVEMMDTELEELLDQTLFDESKMVLIPAESRPFLVSRGGHLIWDEGWWLACDLGKFQLELNGVWYGQYSVGSQAYLEQYVLPLYHGHISVVENWDTENLTPEQAKRPTEVDRAHGKFLADMLRGCSGVAIMDGPTVFQGSLATGSISTSEPTALRARGPLEKKKVRSFRPRPRFR